MGRISKQTHLDKLGQDVAEKLGEGFKVHANETSTTVTYSPDGVQHCSVRTSYKRPDFRGKLPLEMPQIVVDGAVQRYREESLSETAPSQSVRLAAEAYRKVKHLATDPAKQEVRPARQIGSPARAEVNPEASMLNREFAMQMVEAIQDLTIELQALTATLAKPKRYEMTQVIETPRVEE